MRTKREVKNILVKSNNKDDFFSDISSITLAELIDIGFFDWDKELFNWGEQAFDIEQHDRICQMFVDRFYWREISVVPPLKWAQILMHKLKNEAMPKFMPLYKKINEGVNWFSETDEYGKRRSIDSGFPETMLSGAAVYASSGNDEEWETVTESPTFEKYNKLSKEFTSVDQKLLDELECMFSSLWSQNVNGW